MVQSNADRQKAYRKRNAQSLRNAQAQQAGVLAVTDDGAIVTNKTPQIDSGSSKPNKVVVGHPPKRTQPEQTQSEQPTRTPPVSIEPDGHYATRTDPDSLNWGEWMTADQLHEAGLKANRVSIPGDWDYVGVAV